MQYDTNTFSNILKRFFLSKIEPKILFFCGTSEQNYPCLNFFLDICKVIAKQKKVINGNEEVDNHKFLLQK